MDIIRRNTDYALRAMAHLAKNYGGESISTRVIADREDISYQLACKLMQKMNDVGLVTSTMGPKGGFTLSKEPSMINLLEIIEAVQGPVTVNRCLAEEESCPRKDTCPLSGKMREMQDYIIGFLSDATLAGL
ncbi:MAG: Rrf2 family transcriptional regulator [Phycisphaerae bacterium]|nr:Rrf2 family transcriptional regulator [Phycisphaerae bacterium]